MIYVAKTAYKENILIFILPRKATQRECEELSFREQTNIAALVRTGIHGDRVLVQAKRSCCPLGVFLVHSSGGKVKDKTLACLLFMHTVSSQSAAALKRFFGHLELAL